VDSDDYAIGSEASAAVAGILAFSGSSDRRRLAAVARRPHRHPRVQLLMAPAIE